MRRIVDVMTTSRPERRRRLTALALGGLLLLSLAPSSVGAAQRHTLDVGSRGDFVAQTNFVQCVGASMQMMLNMIEPGRDRSARTQRRLQDLARHWSGPRPGGGDRQGASVRGWAAGLNIEGGGPYRLVGEDTLAEAMRTAAEAIAATGKPVGLLVWRGRHAWVMSGFEATKDPQLGGKVTGAVIYDPLYPYGSNVWGPSPKPGETLSLGELGRQFVKRRTSSFSGTLGGKYVLVLPYLPDTSRSAAA